jgi:hypothetical protein
VWHLIADGILLPPAPTATNRKAGERGRLPDALQTPGLRTSVAAKRTN